MIADQLRSKVRYDSDTGLFFGRHDKPLGMHHNAGYVTINVLGRKWLAHRLAWLYVYGEWPGVIDHIDGNRTNNRIANLRSVDRRINSQNMRNAMKNSSTGLLGVSYCKQTGRWVSAIRINGKKTHIGRFASPEEAHAAYLSVKRIHHEGNTL